MSSGASRCSSIRPTRVPRCGNSCPGGAGSAVVLSVPHEPYFCLANLARGKNLRVRPRGSDPDHKQFWTRRAFGEFVTQSGVLDVEWLGGSVPMDDLRRSQAPLSFCWRFR
ncbi:MAG: hypothetical protein KatS3mg059_1693 [Thermomicrobiales bacterium]|nr:MAG: hypothetical protein KatS3mg059_1693 [Thermomicrobiales bacterium]